MSSRTRSSPRLRAKASPAGDSVPPLRASAAGLSSDSEHDSSSAACHDSDMHSDSALSPHSDDGQHSSDGGNGAASSGGSKARVNRWAPNPNRKRFKLLRSFTMADFVTLGNAACGTCSIFFCLNFLENEMFIPYLHGAFLLLPLALFFDIFDGYVARYRENSSPYGSDLDSLADVISFAVAPAVLGFTLGLRGAWDACILAFFVCCGVSRLARYNVTAETLAGEATRQAPKDGRKDGCMQLIDPRYLLYLFFFL